MRETVVALGNAIVERLRAARLPGLRFLGAYAGELDAGFAEVVRAVPALWVCYAGADPPRAMNLARDRFHAQVRFSILAAARLRDPVARAHSLLTQAQALLFLHDARVPDADFLVPGETRLRVDPLLRKAGLEAAEQEWRCRVRFRLREPGRRALDRNLAGYLPPEGERLPGNAHLQDPAHLPPFAALEARYWLLPPLEAETPECAAQDRIPLNPDGAANPAPE